MATAAVYKPNISQYIVAIVLMLILVALLFATPAHHQTVSAATIFALIATVPLAIMAIVEYLRYRGAVVPDSVTVVGSGEETKVIVHGINNVSYAELGFIVVSRSGKRWVKGTHVIDTVSYIPVEPLSYSNGDGYVSISIPQADVKPPVFARGAPGYIRWFAVVPVLKLVSGQSHLYLTLPVKIEDVEVEVLSGESGEGVNVEFEGGDALRVRVDVHSEDIDSVALVISKELFIDGVIRNIASEVAGHVRDPHGTVEFVWKPRKPSSKVSVIVSKPEACNVAAVVSPGDVSLEGAVAVSYDAVVSVKRRRGSVAPEPVAMAKLRVAYKGLRLETGTFHVERH